MVKLEKRNTYVTSDSEVFLDVHLAKAHELRLQLMLMAERESWGSGGHWDADMFVDSLIEKKDELVEIFREFRKDVL